MTCRKIVEGLAHFAPPIESLIQLRVSQASDSPALSSQPSALDLAHAALRFVNLLPDGQSMPLLSGVENLLLSKVCTDIAFSCHIPKTKLVCQDWMQIMLVLHLFSILPQ